MCVCVCVCARVRRSRPPNVILEHIGSSTSSFETGMGVLIGADGIVDDDDEDDTGSHAGIDVDDGDADDESAAAMYAARVAAVDAAAAASPSPNGRRRFGRALAMASSSAGGTLKHAGSLGSITYSSLDSLGGSMRNVLAGVTGTGTGSPRAIRVRGLSQARV